LENSLIYYRTPAEAAAVDSEPGRTLRVSGTVEPGSLVQGVEESRFVLVTEGQRLPVRTSTVPPATLREGEDAVVEGQLTPGKELVADTVLMKHSNEYRAASSR